MIFGTNSWDWGAALALVFVFTLLISTNNVKHQKPYPPHRAAARPGQYLQKRMIQNLLRKRKHSISNFSISTSGADDGQWVYRPQTPYLAPVCCGWDANAFRNNPPSDNCGQDDMPRNEGSFVGRREFVAHSGGNGCSCAAAERPERWVWESTSLPQFNATLLCDLLGNRTMMFIGDSTMAQTASTVMNAVFHAGCQTQMSFYPADTLVGRALGHMNRGRAWTSWVDELNPDVVIISAGAHIDDNSSFDMVLQEFLNATLHYRETSPQRQIIWKTQQPAGCTSNISDGINVNKSQYNYNMFRLRDTQCIAKLKAHTLPFLDLQMLYNRSDAHVGGNDCLHMCMPGPLDIIPVLLQHVLKRKLE